MALIRRILLSLAIASLGVVGHVAWAAEAVPPAVVAMESVPGGVEITVGGAPFASFVYADEAISRPYFAHVRAPNGVPVTRNHPPLVGSDPSDHPTFHPGIWLALGDVSGSDGWRLKAPVRFEGFVEEPHGSAGEGGFVARFSHRDQRDPAATICSEEFRCAVRALPEGTLLLWDSTFTADKEFSFGDQEEMGLGVRMATPLRAERQSKKEKLPPGGGEIVSADGDRNEEGIWGTAPAWCDYRGEVAGQGAGIAILCHPENFRPSRFHVRDYGLMVANPFGMAAFKQGEPTRVTVAPGESLRLRYGILIHDGGADIDAALGRYVELAAGE